jgi:rhodanese-related sulfurtransferase
MVSNDVKMMSRFWLVGCLLIAIVAACTPNEGELTSGTAPKVITAEELTAQIQNAQAPLILDVRTEKEYADGHIPGALNIPHDQLADRLSEIDAAKTEEIVVHCRSGHRAGIAEKVLIEAGYSNVRDLDGHMNGWRSGGYPIEEP